MAKPNLSRPGKGARLLGYHQGQPVYDLREPTSPCPRCPVCRRAKCENPAHAIPSLEPELNGERRLPGTEVP